MNSREQFEAAVIARLGAMFPPDTPAEQLRSALLQRSPDGDYADHQRAGEWWAWQASRENARDMVAASTEQPLLPIGILAFGADVNSKPSYHHACDDPKELVRVLDEGLTGGPYRAVPVFDVDTLRSIVARAVAPYLDK